MGRGTRWRRAPRRWIVSAFTRLLTKPLKSYELRVPNDLVELKAALRKGDVLLVEGDQRVSQVIRYLTQSSWSHAAIYIGDELLRGDPRRAAEVRQRFGDEAQYLLVEAIDGEGVVASPLQKYEHYNVRLCRPQGLRREDVAQVLEAVIEHLGDEYDVRHMVDLARYFFPVSFLRRRWRRSALRLGRRSKHEVICSSMIARAFARVGYPIMPRVVSAPAGLSRSWWRRLFGGNGHRYAARFRRYPAALVTPRDFDLSPYFEVVKFNHMADPHFDYREIIWEDTEEGGEEAAASANGAEADP